MRARLLLLVLVLWGGVRGALAQDAGGLVVHEWGTFTQRFDPSGAAVSWSPLAVVSDLPKFVYQSSRGPKRTIQGTVRMETPVIYFYPQGTQSVSVDVGFPGGVITEWYPRARRTRAGVRWPAVTLLPGASARLPREAADSHYYPARDTDAAVVRVRRAGRSQHEKFLFYRGVGTFDLPLAARLDGDTVLVTTRGAQAIGRVIVFESRGGSVGFRTADTASEETPIARPVAAAGALEGFEAELFVLLVGAGLFEPEARAMINTWRSTWSEEGLRVFYLVPRPVTETVLPVSIAPAPASFVRVLVGRAEILPAT